jgi:predicted protein tyrosine phosphatase
MPSIFRASFENTLRLTFRDTDYEDDDLPPRRYDVRKFIDYYEATKDESTGYVIHCHAGISRSTAVGLGILYLMNHSEKRAMQSLLRVRPIARPHLGIVGHFDSIMGSNLLPLVIQVRDEADRRESIYAT